MTPRDTRYRLAETGTDYRRAHVLAAAQGQAGGSYTWPTVLAERGQVLIGVLATTASDRAIVAGPLAVATPRPLVVAIRLIDSYEGVLRYVGVRSYLFSIDRENKVWRDLVATVMPGLEPYASTDDAQWFVRRLP